MTTIDQIITPTPFDAVAVDLYRDIHKGIRTELFAVTTAAGSIDPHVVGFDDVASRVDPLTAFLMTL